MATTDDRKPVFSFNLDRDASQLVEGVTPKLERYMAGAIEALLYVAAFGGNLTVRSDKERIRVYQYPVEELPKHTNGSQVTPEIAGALFGGAAKVIQHKPVEAPPAPPVEAPPLVTDLRQAKIDADRAKQEESLARKKAKMREHYLARRAAGIYYPSDIINGRVPKWGKILQTKGIRSEDPDAMRDIPEEFKGLPLRDIPVAKSPLPLKIASAVMKWDPSFTLGDLDALGDRHLQKIPGIAKRHYPVIREAIALAGTRQ